MKKWQEYLSEESKARNASKLKYLGKFLGLDDMVSLGGGLPHQDVFPFKGVSYEYPTVESNFIEIATAKLGEDPNSTLYEALQYPSGVGNKFLVGWTKEHIEMVHHPKYADWDTVVCAGATQALDTTLRTLCDPGDVVLLEDITYPTALETVKPMKLQYAPVTTDAYGIVPSEMDKMLAAWDTSKRPMPKVFYTIPTGQNPTGTTMPLERRLEFYKVCQKYDIIIIEDDPYYFLQLGAPISKDGKFSTELLLKRLIPSLLSIDTDGRVIRFDSFSKVMVPGSRTGSITANKVFVERIIRHNEVNIQSAAGFSQLLLYSILTRWGHDGYLQWLEKIRLEYTRRRDLLIDAFDKYLPKHLCSWNCPESGMFLWIDLNMEKFPKPAGVSELEWANQLESKVFEAAVGNKVLLSMGHWFVVPPSERLTRSGFRATYASASAEQIVYAAQRFAKTLTDLAEN